MFCQLAAAACGARDLFNARNFLAMAFTPSAITLFISQTTDFCTAPRGELTVPRFETVSTTRSRTPTKVGAAYEVGSGNGTEGQGS